PWRYPLPLHDALPILIGAGWSRFWLILAARRSIFPSSFSVRTFCARRPLRFLVTPLLSAVAKHASDSSQELRPASSLSDSMIMGRQCRLPCMDADWHLLVNTKL